MSRLEEVGISNYYNNFPLVQGRIKVLPEDFVVQEIYAGEVCKEAPKINIDSVILSHNSFLKLAQTPAFQVVDPRILKSVESTDDLLEIYKKFFLDDLRPEEETKFGGRKCIKEVLLGKYKCIDKASRTQIHKEMKTHPLIKTKFENSFINFILSSTNTYTFTVKKVNRDTADVASRLCRKLGRVAFAGNKDKRAVTYQRMSVKTDFMLLYSEEVADIRRGFPLKLGDLQGNSFKVCIKNCSIKNTQKLLFLNYFGNQRFGKNLNNHKVGALIINKQYEDALNLIIQTYSALYDSSAEEGASVYALYNSHKYEDALSKIHQKFKTERHIILCRMKNVKLKIIFNTMKRESLMLYLHAYQSYLFNLSINALIESLSAPKKCPEKLRFDGEKFVPDENVCLEEVWLRIEKLDHPLCKGGYRKVVEAANDFQAEPRGTDTLLKFWLRPCSFATVAIREFIGDDILA